MARHEAFGHKLPLEPDQYEMMTQHVANLAGCNRLRRMAFLALWWDTLARIEDVCGLSVEQVQGKSVITLTQGKVSIVDGKTGNRARVGVTCYLKPKTVELIAAYLTATGKVASDPLFTAQGCNAWIAYERKNSSGETYTTRVGMCPDTVRKEFKGWCAAIGLDASRYSTHSIRRGRITDLLRKGQRTKTVQLLAGHRDARSTIGYDTPTEDELMLASMSA